MDGVAHPTVAVVWPQLLHHRPITSAIFLAPTVATFFYEPTAGPDFLMRVFRIGPCFRLRAGTGSGGACRTATSISGAVVGTSVLSGFMKVNGMHFICVDG